MFVISIYFMLLQRSCMLLMLVWWHDHRRPMRYHHGMPQFWVIPISSSEPSKKLFRPCGLSKILALENQYASHSEGIMKVARAVAEIKMSPSADASISVMIIKDGRRRRPKILRFCLIKDVTYPPTPSKILLRIIKECHLPTYPQRNLIKDY